MTGFILLMQSCGSVEVSHGKIRVRRNGDLAITPNYDITGLNIKLEANGVTYINSTVSLNAGQSYTDCLMGLAEGTYILTLSTVDGIIDQYEITVEED